MTALPTHDDVQRARERLGSRVLHTPLLRHPVLDAACGGTVLVKPESLQRTGSFKLRGASNAVLRLASSGAARALVTYSSGNHGQAVACAGAASGLPVTVFMPQDAPAAKREATARWGAAIIAYDRLRDDREALAREHAASTGGALIPPFDHADVIAGQGTLALELFADAAGVGLHLDALLVPAGGGGLIAGCALAAEGVSPATRLFAVEPEGWDDTRRSLIAAERVANPPGGSLLCDALLAVTPGELTFAINRSRLAGGIAVSDAEVLAAMAFAFRHLKLVVEPGGAVALAALLAGRVEVRGRVVGVVISGGNVDAGVFGRALEEGRGGG